MGEIHDPAQVLLIMAVSSRHAEAIDWARERVAEHYNGIALASDAFDFTETDYYAVTRAAGLKKQLFACERLIDPGRLADIKRETNQWEAEFAALGRHAEP